MTTPTLTSIPMAAQQLGGAIKQADAMIAECELLHQRAVASVERATKDLDAARERAADLRAQLHALAEHAHNEIKGLDVAQAAAAQAAQVPETGGEVIQSTPLMDYEAAVIASTEAALDPPQPQPTDPQF